MAEVTKSTRIIRQVQVDNEPQPYDLGGSIYNLDEVDTAIADREVSETETVVCLIFDCGSSTKLV